MNNDKIILRNIKEQDIEDYVKWLTDKKYSEWLNWDAPWEHEDSFDADEERRRWTKFFEASEALDPSKLRHRFEIEVNDKHVGWVSAYDDLGYMENPDKHLAIGIDIPEMDVWGKGIGTKALQLFIDYYREQGEKVLYIQTWSGNERMLKVMNKLGFHEFYRAKGIREVNGQKFDAVTYVLDL